MSRKSSDSFVHNDLCLILNHIDPLYFTWLIQVFWCQISSSTRLIGFYDPMQVWLIVT